MKLDPALLLTDDYEEPGNGTDTLRACINAHGMYEPGFFVLRLSPVMHEALNSIDLHNARTFHELPDAQKQALSTRFHETIHWWQHVGATFGFIYSLSRPAQTHYNLSSLQGISRRDEVFKPLKRWAEGLIRSGDSTSELVGDLLDVLSVYTKLTSFRGLTFAPNLANQVVSDPYFDCPASAFRVAFTAALATLSVTVDSDLKALPDARQWKAKFERLRAEGVPGFVKSPTINIPCLGVKQLFEGQARLSQIQFLYLASAQTLTWEDFRSAGMLSGVYVEAFNLFLKLTGSSWPATPTDPLIGLFLLLCEVAANPGYGFPFDTPDCSHFITDNNPGHRFLHLCHVTNRSRGLLSAIREYSDEEYREISTAVSRAINTPPPLEIAGKVASWPCDHPGFRSLMEESETFSFSDPNLPIRVFLAQFINFQRDKLRRPSLFCWPGISSVERAGTSSRDFEEITGMLAKHEALFFDNAAGSIQIRKAPGRTAEAAFKVQSIFYGCTAAYRWTNEWIAGDGEFDDLSWYTTELSLKDRQEWGTHYFRLFYGREPNSIRIIEATQS